MDENQQTTQPAEDTEHTCPRCKRSISTHRKGSQIIYNTHGPDPSGAFYCLNSAEPVH